VTITGTGFLSGATVTLGGTAATNVNVVKHIDHRDDTGARRWGSECGCDQHRCPERFAEQGLYLHAKQSCADGGVDHAQHGDHGRGTSVTITGTGFSRERRSLWVERRRRP
jgi:hypothetical protein